MGWYDKNNQEGPFPLSMPNCMAWLDTVSGNMLRRRRYTRNAHNPWCPSPGYTLEHPILF